MPSKKTLRERALKLGNARAKKLGAMLIARPEIGFEGGYKAGYRAALRDQRKTYTLEKPVKNRKTKKGGGE